ncbi:MAG TPA: hypothetical protein VLK23_09885 [Thermodesulfobacteriota bacterium]|nr:hypothetical protein [Thermodesulfobacteriota bacterium]
MVAYEFYLHDEEMGDILIGILPERRKNSNRINEESIMKWGRMVLGEKGESKNIYYTQIKLD